MVLIIKKTVCQLISMTMLISQSFVIGLSAMVYEKRIVGCFLVKIN